MTIGILTMIPAADVRAVWPSVRDRVSAIAAATGEGWVVEDVFHEIIVGNAFLWATEDLGCFVVLQIDQRPYQRSLFVWIASEETEARAADYVPQIQDIGRENGCQRVVFESPRRWDRALPGLTVRHIYSFGT